MTWIIPKQLHTSACALDTEALSLDLNEQSQICAQSLFVRSKPSQLRIWSAKWKRDSWTQHLSGRILKPSLGQRFATEWTSSLEATHASHSVQPGSAEARTTQGTCGPTSQTAFDFSDLGAASLKTSKDISAWGCPTSSKTWQEWVIERRGAYSARLNAERLTKGSECSSWPTMTANEAENSQGKSQLNRRPPPSGRLCYWPTVQASEARQGFQNRSRGMKGSQESLSTVVVKHGPHVPASSSTNGSRQGLSWPTPQTMDVLPVRPVETFAESNRTRGGRKNRKALSNLREAIHSPVYQVKQWQTATVSTGANKQKDGSMTDKLDRQVNGKLNPRWVETLMGLPVGWTMPSCASPVTIERMSSDCSVTVLYQQQQNEPLEY